MLKQKVSIIIPCRNEKNYIEKCVQAIFANSYGIENIEVVIVDGLSDDGTRNIIIEKFHTNPSVKLIDNILKTTPHAFNLGIENASGEFIVIVGARQIIAQNYIEVCVEILNDNKEIGCTGGKVENIYENTISKLIAKAMSSPFGVGSGNFRIKNSDGFVDTVGTPVYRKSIFNEIGLFDPQLVRNQDDELNFRLLKHGYKIFLTTKTSLHYYVRASFKKLFKQYYQYGYWKVYVNKKHKTLTTYRQLAPMFLVLFFGGGLILSFFNLLFTAAFLFSVCLYIFVASFMAFYKNKISESPKIVFSFFILHWSYGFGYIEGIINFILLNKKPSDQNKTLSR